MLAHIANQREGARLMAGDELVQGERHRATAFILFYNTTVALKQPFSALNFIHAAGKGSSKYLAKELMNFMSSGIRHNEMMQAIHELSPNMARRWKQIDRDLQKPEAFGRIRKPTRGESMKSYLSRITEATGPIMIRMMDAATAYPAWMAAYKMEMDKNGGDVDAAVSFADNVIAATQPFDRPLDKPIVRSSKAGLAGLFTMFTGYTIKFANRRAFYYEGFKTYLRTGGESGINGVDFMTHVLIERILPSIAMTTMVGLLRGDLCGDDGECGAEDLPQYGVDLLLFQFIGRYLIQDVASLGVSLFGKGYIRDLGTPVSTGVEVTAYAIKKMFKSLEDGSWDEKTSIAVARVLEYFAPILKVPHGAYDMATEEE
jgi:hypothetical protein